MKIKLIKWLPFYYFITIFEFKIFQNSINKMYIWITYRDFNYGAPI